MALIPIILIIIVLFLIVNGIPLGNPIRWVCNVLLGFAVLIYVFVAPGIGLHV